MIPQRAEDQEVDVRRRQFLMTGLASILTTPAAAQEQKLRRSA